MAKAPVTNNRPAASTSRFVSAFFALMLAVAWSGAAAEPSSNAVNRVLALPKAPPGVVFEIVSASESELEQAVPKVTAYSRQLRQRFAQLPIAVVTHGREMFALQSNSRDAAPQVHAGVESLSKNDIPVHVCETYAGMRGIGAEAFPSYVNVAPSGPSQIKNYLELGYILIKI